MHPFQRVVSRFYGFYAIYRQFEQDDAMYHGDKDRLVYLDDYLLAWLGLGNGIEACGRDFSILMQAHSALLIDLTMGSPTPGNPFYREEADGSITDLNTIPAEEWPRRTTANPVSALGTSSPGKQGEEYDYDQCALMSDYDGLIHPAFLKEWFDYLAALEPSARKQEWHSLWSARNQAVVTPE